jgi:peptidoglycan/xylan/chitin deacetylase (PgdA/CDA1 family)
VIRALRLDDVGAATKRNEVYGRTRIPVGPLQVPFPGNFLFLKYLPGIRKWGPYAELSPAVWETFLALLERKGWPVTVGITASWVEDDGSLTPFPKKFPAQAALLKQAAEKGVIEIANHGLTHCVVAGNQFKPRWFSSNRKAHREFWEWIPESTQKEALERSQDILQSYFGPVVTLIPPGNVYQPSTVRLAKTVGIRLVSCKTPTRVEDGVAYVGDEELLAFHDREIALEGPSWLEKRIAGETLAPSLAFVKTIGLEMLSPQAAHV